MEYIKVSEAAAKWGLSARRVRVLCSEGRIGGVVRKGNLYMIPSDALRPADGRTTRTTESSLRPLLQKIDQLKSELTQFRSHQRPHLRSIFSAVGLRHHAGRHQPIFRREISHATEGTAVVDGMSNTKSQPTRYAPFTNWCLPTVRKTVANGAVCRYVFLAH